MAEEDPNLQTNLSAAATAENSGGTATITAALEEQKNKRARRVSFAEMTSIHFFDRDDEYETNSDGSTKASARVEDADQIEEDNNCEGKEESEDGEEDEEVDVRSFFRPSESPSPGSNLGSATSNDEDNFFGPVSTTFIRPGRLSGSATSDDNHDITMDSTAFSMHFRSLARSESGDEMKTPTGIKFSFNEKTPSQTTLGSSMALTVTNKPIFKSDLHVANISGCSDSSDMSLVVENSRKYEYDKLLSGVDDKYSEVEKNLLVNLVPRDRESSDMSLEVENPLKYESSVLLPGVDDILVEVDKNVQVNLVSANTGGSRSPGAVKSNLLHLEEQGNDYMESDYPTQAITADAHNDILIYPVFENQMDDANCGSRADVRHSTSPVAPCSLDPHPSSSISVDNAIVSSNMEKTVVKSKKMDEVSPLSHPTELDQDTELIESNGNNQHEGGSLLQELRSSPTKQNRSIMDSSTPSKYSSLFTPPQNKNAEVPQGVNSSIQKSILKLEKLKTSSISSYRKKKSSDSYIHHLIPPEPAQSREFLDLQEKLLNFEKFRSPLRQEESQSHHPVALDGTLTSRLSPSGSRHKLPKDELQAIPGSASLTTRNLTDSRLQKNLFECFEKSPPKQYVSDVNVPEGNHQPEMENFVSLFQLTEEFRDSSARKRRNNFEMKSGDKKDEEILTMKSPKLQKIGSNDEVLGSPSEAYVGTHKSGHGLKSWTDIYAKFSEDAERLLPPSTENLNLHAIDMMNDVLVSLQRSKSYTVLCDGILLQKNSTIINKDSKRIVDARSLLQTILYERVKSQLMRLKRAKLQDKQQHLTSGLLDSQMLKSSLLPQHFPTVTPAGTLANKDVKEVSCDRVTALLQHLKDSDNKISNSLKKFQSSCKIKVCHSCEDTLVLVKEHLMRRVHSRSVRLDIQMWSVHAAESRKGHHTFILSYLDIVIQRVTVNVGPDPSIVIINKVDDTLISKKFPNMDALTAFEFMLNNEYSRKYVGLRSLAQETQVTSSIMRSLLDVVEEVQQAQIEIHNLTRTSFYSQSAEQLGLRLCFLNFKTVKKLTLTLDISCLKQGIYPSDVSPSELSAAIDTKGHSCVEQVQIREINNTVQNVRSGYMRILRLCRCISKAVQNHH